MTEKIQWIQCVECGDWIEAETSLELKRKFESHKKEHQKEHL